MEDIKPSKSWIYETIEKQDDRMSNLENIIHTEQLERVKSTYNLEKAIANGVRQGLSPLESRVSILEKQVHELLHKPAQDALEQIKNQKKKKQDAVWTAITSIIKAISPALAVLAWELLRNIKL